MRQENGKKEKERVHRLGRKEQTAFVWRWHNCLCQNLKEYNKKCPGTTE